MQEMDCKVIHEGQHSDDVELFGFAESEIVLAVVSRTVFEDLFPGRRVSSEQTSILAESNTEIISRIVTAKYEAGDVERQRGAGLRTLIRVRLPDVLASGEAFSDSVLDHPFQWAARG
jgi:hypothetical protein